MAVETAQAPPVSVTFTTHFVVENDTQVIAVSGSIPELGSWRPETVFRLVPQEGGMWTGTLKIPTGTKFEWKLVLVDLSSCMIVRWEESLNRVLHLNEGRKLYLECRWGFPGIFENEENWKSGKISGLDKHCENDIKFPGKRVAETEKRNLPSMKRYVRFISFSEDKDIDFETNEDDEEQEIDELFGKYCKNEKDFQQETKGIASKRNPAALQYKGKPDRMKVGKRRCRAFKRKIKKSVLQDDSNGSSKEKSWCPNYTRGVNNIDNNITTYDEHTGEKNIAPRSKTTKKETGQDFTTTISVARNDIGKVHTKAQYMVDENKVRKLNVRELKKLFEELSKEQCNKNYKRWSEDYDLLLRRKRVKLLTRLMLEKEHPERFNGRHKLLKSSSAPSCPNDFFMSNIKDRIKHTELSEDDQATIEKLFHELGLHEKDPQLETFPMSNKHSKCLPSTSNYDFVGASRVSRFAGDELLCHLSPRSAGTQAESRDVPSASSLFPRSAQLIDYGGNKGLVLSKTGNDECPNEQDTKNTDILALCRRNKVVTCTAITSFLGLAMILAFTYLKLRK